MQRNPVTAARTSRDGAALEFVRHHALQIAIITAITIGVVATVAFGPSSPAGAVGADSGPVGADSGPVATAGIDENSNPDGPSSPVYAVVEANGRYYIGGDFQTIAGETQPYLAAIEVATGRLDQLWRPEVNGMVTALAMSPDGSALYVGGKFFQIDEQFPSRIAKLDPVTGAVDPTFDPDATAVVESIVTDGSSVWASGVFQTIGGVNQAYVAKMDSSGVVDTAFNPVVDNKVLDLELDGNRLYMGGNFTTIDGVTHERIASVDATTGDADAWAPTSGFKVYDVSLKPAGGILYAAGAGSLRAGGNSLTAWDTTTGELLWRRVNSGDFQAVVATDDLVYIGTHGEFIYIDNDGPFLEDDANPNAVRRNKLAAFDPLTGALDSWNPGANSIWGVWSLSLGPSGLLVGGDFTTIGGQVQPHFAVFGGPDVGNKSPVAEFSVSCDGTSCAFDATASSDPDGTISAYAWDFGDGQTSSSATPTVVLADDAMHTVSLTVTDNQNTASRTQNLIPVGSGGLNVELVGVASATTTTASVEIDLPADLADGELAVAFLASADTTAIITPPAGWTEVGTQASGSVDSGIWYAPVSAADADTTVSFGFDKAIKANLSVATFRHVDLANPIATFASEPESVLWAQHSAPSVTTTEPAAVVHFWTDRSGDTTRISGPGNEAVISSVAGFGGGHVNSELSLVSTSEPGAFAESVAIGGLHTRSAVGWTVALTALDITPTCVATLNGDDTVSLAWTDVHGATNNIVRRNNGWVATIGADTTYVDDPGPGTWDYEIRVQVPGDSIYLDCTPQIVVEDPPPLEQTCSATLNPDDTVTLTWDEIPGENSYSVRRNDSYVATSGELSFVDDPGAGTWEYLIRSHMNGTATNTTCAPEVTITTPPFVQTCSATLNVDDTVTIDWTDIPGENGYSVRRNDSYVAFAGDAGTYTDDPGTGTWDYLVRSRMNGVTTDTACTPTITVDTEPPPAQTCAVTFNGDGSATLVWDAIDGEDTYIVRRNGAWLETTSALTFTDDFAEPGDTYLIRSNMAGVQTNTDCN